MGMFDKVGALSKAYPEGTPFILWEARYIGRVDSREYGENTKAEVVVSNPDQKDPGQRTTYAVFGVLAEQIGRMESGDVPAVVKVVREGQAKVWERVSDVDDMPDF